MQILRLLTLAAFAGALVVSAACGEDQANVRYRADAGVVEAGNELDAAFEGGLACGAAIPTTYESASFTANAAVELALAERFVDLEAKMLATEGASDAGTTANELEGIYNAGAPSLRAVSTTSAQTLVDAYLDAYEGAIGKAWTPADADGDGGAASGGKYGSYHFSATGVELRGAAVKTLLGGAVLNHVLGLTASPVTEGTVDRLVAAFGVTPNVFNQPDAAASDFKLISWEALRHADGAYGKIRSAFLMMKGALARGDECSADRDAAVKVFLEEWERTTYASAIFYLDSAARTAADPQKGPDALHAYAQALGFIQSFKGLPAEKRKITDAQVDMLLTKIGADAPYKLVTTPGDRVLKLNEAINDIALYEGFTAAEVEAFRKE